MVQIYIKIPVFMVILGYIYFESMLFFLSFVRKRNCIMIERMETCQNNRSDGNELPSGPGAVLTQSRFLFFLCLWEILLYKLKTLNLRFSEIFVNTHTHTHNSGALCYKLFFEYQRVGSLFSAKISLIYYNISSFAFCSRQNRTAGAYPSAASISVFRRLVAGGLSFFSAIK